MERKSSGCGGCLFSILILLLLVGGIYCFMTGGYNTIKNIEVGKEATTEQRAEPEAGNEKAETYYYRAQLTNKEQSIYDDLYQGLTDLEESIKIKSRDSDEVEKIWYAVLYDHPEIFWCRGGYKLYYLKIGFSMTLEPEYVYAKNEISEKSAKMEEIAKEIAKDNEGKNDYQKILATYRFVIKNTDYEEDAPNNQYIDSVLIGKKSVCAGYSKAIQYLLQKQDIFCTYVSGTAESSTGRGAHAWNIVLCNGKFYHLDATWGDPNYDGNGTTTDGITYDYMLCNDELIGRTHNADNSVFNHPKCDSLDWYYYCVNQRYFTNYDRNEIWNLICYDIDQKSSNSTFKFANDDAYYDAKDDILEDFTQDGMDRIQRKYHIKGKVTCSYIDEKSMDKIIIYWKY
ncbi:MAG: hypothetical protein MJ087_03240 [Lachnospiraceae bacterium]|nr:hypothetical protein [Lachnospiraceae bacterium]